MQRIEYYFDISVQMIRHILRITFYLRISMSHCILLTIHAFSMQRFFLYEKTQNGLRKEETYQVFINY